MKYQLFLGMFSSPIADQQLYQKEIYGLIKKYDNEASEIKICTNVHGLYSAFMSNNIVDLNDYVKKILQLPWSHRMLLFPHGPRPINNYCAYIDDQIVKIDYFKNIPINKSYKIYNIIYDYYPKQLKMIAAATENPEISCLEYKYDRIIGQDYEPIGDYLQLCQVIPNEIYQNFLLNNYLYFQPLKQTISYIKNKNIDNKYKIILHVNYHLRDLHNKIYRDLQSLKQPQKPAYIKNNYLQLSDKQNKLIKTILSHRKQERSCELIRDFPKYSGSLWSIQNPQYYPIINYIWRGQIVNPNHIVQLENLLDLLRFIDNNKLDNKYYNIVLNQIISYDNAINILKQNPDYLKDNLIKQLLVFYQDYTNQKTINTLEKLMYFVRQNYQNIKNFCLNHTKQDIVADCVLFYEYLDLIIYAEKYNKMPTGRGDPLAIKSAVKQMINFYTKYNKIAKLPNLPSSIHQILLNRIKHHNALLQQFSIENALLLWHQNIQSDDINNYKRIYKLYQSSQDHTKQTNNINIQKDNNHYLDYDYLRNICTNINYNNFSMIGQILVEHIKHIKANNNQPFREILNIYINFLQ